MTSVRSLLPLLAATLLALAAACGDDESESPPSGPPSTSAAATSDASVVDRSTTTAAPASTAATTTTTATTATTPVPPTPSLAGRAFVSAAVTGFELVTGTQIRLTFTGDQIGASGGCNQLSSSWSLDGDVLVVGEMASTRMACEPAALMDQDTWVSALLTSDPTVTLDGDTLTLTEGQSSITLVAAP